MAEQGLHTHLREFVGQVIVRSRHIARRLDFESRVCPQRRHLNPFFDSHTTMTFEFEHVNLVSLELPASL